MKVSPCTATYLLGWRYPYHDKEMNNYLKLLVMHAYINVGCIDVVVVTVHITRDWFQHDPVIIICAKYAFRYQISLAKVSMHQKCSLTAQYVSESISASIS